MTDDAITDAATIADLRRRVTEAEEVIRAIRTGTIDGFITEAGQVYTLQSADHAYRVMIESINEGALTISLDGRILFANRKFCNMVGRPSCTVINEDFRGFLLPAGAAEFGRLVELTLSEPVASHQQLRTETGPPMDVRLSLSSLTGEGIPALTVLVTDLTDQLLHHQTAQIRERLELSQSAGDVGTFDWNVVTGTVHWTREQERLFGLPPGGFDGSYGGWSRHVHVDDLQRMEETIARALGENLPFHAEYRIIIPDGSLRWIEAKGVVIRGSDGTPERFIGINLDITQRKHLELRLAATNEELAEYAAVASHDLQAPLRTISSYLTLINHRYADRFDEKASNYFAYILNATELMGQLIRGILDYSQSSDQTLTAEWIDSAEALAAALQALEDFTRVRSAVITCGLLPRVRCNRINLTRVFQNLIGNALKYCVGTPVISIVARHADNEHIFSVTDNGPGIPAESMERIFRLFQRLHTDQQVPGTGIGLATCKKIIDRQGGRIWVESAPNSGSTFVFTIPGKAGD